MDIPVKKLADGNKIPVIGLGTWLLEGNKCTEAVKMGLELGYRHIDTAYAYYNHEFIKKAIEGFPREELFITSKLWREHLEADKVEFACDICLKQLGTDYLDLFLVHWPNNALPMHETVLAMHKLKEKGKIRSVGVSNYTIHHLQDLIDKKIQVVTNQVEFHPFLYQKELLSFCENNDIAITAYSPLGHHEVFKDKFLKEIGEKYQKTAGQISLRWMIQKGIIVIPKASSESHLRENIEIFDFEISASDMEKIDQRHREMEKRLIVPDFNEFDY